MNKQEIIAFIKKEMDWNGCTVNDLENYVNVLSGFSQYIVKYKDAEIFLEYWCLPGSSVIPELKEVISQTPYSCKISRGIYNRRNEFEHDYLIQLRLK